MTEKDRQAAARADREEMMALLNQLEGERSPERADDTPEQRPEENHLNGARAPEPERPAVEAAIDEQQRKPDEPAPVAPEQAAEEKPAETEPEAAKAPEPERPAVEAAVDEQQQKPAEPSPVAPPAEDKGEAAARVERTAEERRRKMSKYEEICKKPSMKMNAEDLKIWDELSDIMCSTNKAVNLITEFQRRFPDKASPEKMRTVKHNLKEVSSIMLREFHSLRHGKANKTYDKSQVCQVCHAVYMVPLPGGICDECRSKMGASNRGGAY